MDFLKIIAVFIVVLNHHYFGSLKVWQVYKYYLHSIYMNVHMRITKIYF